MKWFENIPKSFLPFMIRVTDNDVPLTPYLSKGQKKKDSKDAYQTRSRGPPPSHQEDLLLEY